MLNIQGSASGYKFPLTPDQVTLGKRLLAVLNDPSGEDQPVLVLHEFLYPFISKQEPREEYSKWFDALECFMAIYSLKSDGNYEDASGCTQLFAILKYICRGTTLYEAFQRFKEDPAKPAM